MRGLVYIILVGRVASAVTALVLVYGAGLLAGEMGHHGTHEQKNRSAKAPVNQKLLPADGARVKIISPRMEQVFKTDQIPLEFKMIKGKRGHHVHAYVNGQLMGMFTSTQGTLTGIKPGKHVLELRVVAEDHHNELNAIDQVRFTVQ